MKKAVVVIVMTLSFAAFGELEKICTIQLADVSSLVGGISKVGEFTGNQMLGAMASSALTQSYCISTLGPGRDGVPFAVTVFWDGKDFAFSVLFPITHKQGEFLAKNPGTVGKDGVISLLKADRKAKGTKYVQYSSDGKWVAMSERKSLVARTLKDVKLVERPMKGDLVRIVVNKAGINAIMANATKNGKASKANHDMVALSECENVAFGLVVDDNGLALRGTINVAKGSRLAACGLKPLGADPLAFADKDALVAYAIASDCGHVDAGVERFFDVLKKYGIKTDFLVCEEKNNCKKFTLDIPKAVKNIADSTNSLTKADMTKMAADFKNLTSEADEFKVENPAICGSFVIKGNTTSTAPAMRLRKVLPGISSRKPYRIQVCSLYAIIRAVLPHVLDGMSPDERVAFAPIVASLAPSGNGGIASAAWREKNAHCFTMRISADEFKSVSAGFAAFAVHQMQKMQKMQNRGMKRGIKR